MCFIILMRPVNFDARFRVCKRERACLLFNTFLMSETRWNVIIWLCSKCSRTWKPAKVQHERKLLNRAIQLFLAKGETSRYSARILNSVFPFLYCARFDFLFWKICFDALWFVMGIEFVLIIMDRICRRFVFDSF